MRRETAILKGDPMTATGGHDWITLHRLRFPEAVSSFERVFPPVVGPDCWLFGPHYDVGADGMLTGVSDIWGGVGIWHSREAAEAMEPRFVPVDHAIVGIVDDIEVRP